MPKREAERSRLGEAEPPLPHPHITPPLPVLWRKEVATGPGLEETQRLDWHWSLGRTYFAGGTTAEKLWGAARRWVIPAFDGLRASPWGRLGRRRLYPTSAWPWATDDSSLPIPPQGCPTGCPGPLLVSFLTLSRHSTARSAHLFQFRAGLWGLGQRAGGAWGRGDEKTRK